MPSAACVEAWKMAHRAAWQRWVQCRDSGDTAGRDVAFAIACEIFEMAQQSIFPNVAETKH